MKTYVGQQRAEHPSGVLVLNAGDDFIGTEWDRRYGIDWPTHFMNMLSPDAMVGAAHPPATVPLFSRTACLLLTKPCTLPAGCLLLAARCLPSMALLSSIRLPLARPATSLACP